MNLKNPLVSVRVITYNSTKYVIETLESIKNQTYQNIELIISDDCSTDNTVAVCKDWINKNKERFIRTEILTVDKNTGISGNSNRSIKASQGEWLKGIGGDDVLLDDCIQKDIEFTIANPQIKILSTSYYAFKESFDAHNFLYERNFINHPITNDSISASQQHKILLFGCFVGTPTLFIKKSVFDDYGLFNEKYKEEDWQFYLNVTKKGCKIFYMNHPTVCYRVRHNSLSQSYESGKIFNNKYMRVHEITRDLIYPELPFLDKVIYKYYYNLNKAFEKLKINKPQFSFFYKSLLYPYILHRRISRSIRNLDVNTQLSRVNTK